MAGAATAASNGGTGIGDIIIPAPEELGRLQVDKVLDCSGEMCPRPQLLTKRAVVKEMDVGQVLELVVDNPSSPDLVPTIMNDIGAVHLHTVRTEHEWKLYIRKERELAGRSGARKS